MVRTGRLHGRLAYPTAAEFDANLALCENPDDGPIILDAVAENCDFLVADDMRLRRSKSPIPSVPHST